MRYAILAFAALAAAPGARAQTDSTMVHIDSMPVPPSGFITHAEAASYRGFSFCYQEQGYSFIAIGQDSMTVKEVTAHELKHQEQMTRYDSCAVFNQAYKGPLGFLTFEAEAYMAGYCAVRPQLSDTAYAKEQIVKQLFQSLGAATIREEIVEALDRYPCK